MGKIKLAIIYYSSTGTNYRLARWAEEGAREAGADVRVLRVQELASQEAIDSNPAWRQHFDATKDVPIASNDDLEWADAYIFSTPTRYGNVSSQMKQFIDGTGGVWSQGKLANKVVSAMASAGNAYGGQVPTIKSLYTTMMHWGAIIASPGYTDKSVYIAGGNPYGVSVTVDQDGNIMEDAQEAVKHQARRTVSVAKWIKEGMRS
ncbi:MAG: NAD(P)H:quinone oxidoreductase [Tissierellia bacterium]|nr:NAD(P)H:quinone oxidoreductase [Tissierellia bacterium]